MTALVWTLLFQPILPMTSVVTKPDTTNIPVRTELHGRTNYVYMGQVPLSTATQIVTLVVPYSPQATQPHRSTVTLYCDATNVWQTSVDLIVWSNVGVTGTFTVTLPMDSPHRFYRGRRERFLSLKSNSVVLVDGVPLDKVATDYTNQLHIK